MMWTLLLPVRWVALLVQGVLLALGQIWTNKLRSVLTTIGIVIGVSSVTSVIAALTGLEANVLNEFEKFGTNKMFVNPMMTDADMAKQTPWSHIRFKPDLFDSLLQHAPSISAYTRSMDFTETVTFEQRKVSEVLITGIDAAWHKIERREAIEGRSFSLIDIQRALPVCLVDQVLQNSLRLNRDPSGQSIVIGNRRFTVIGVVDVDPSGGMFGRGSDNGSIYIPFTTASRMQPRENITLIATARGTQYTEDAAAELNFYMRQARHVPPGGQDSFRVFYVAKEVERFKTVATVIRAVATCIVGISLIVGGVGIMNIMFVSVSERTREIGLRKALGATPAAILLQFLVEAVTLCCIGGGIGLGIGQLITHTLKGIALLQLDKAYIPFWAVLLSIGFSAGVGLTFGMFPAIKAARLDPIDALRHE